MHFIITSKHTVFPFLNSMYLHGSDKELKKLRNSRLNKSFITLFVPQFLSHISLLFIHIFYRIQKHHSFHLLWKQIQQLRQTFSDCSFSCNSFFQVICISNHKRCDQRISCTHGVNNFLDWYRFLHIIFLSII